MEIMSLEFIPIFIVGFFTKLVAAGVGYGLVRLILRHLDNVIDFNFKEWFSHASDQSKAIYLAARIMSIAIFMAWIIS